MRIDRTSGSFAAVTVVFGLFMVAASVPSPLYGVYALRWHFSPATLTLVFAVYVVALLAALLTTGTLSDRLGRRPVLLGALVVQSVAMVAFLLADGVAWLYLARVLQGLATGVATTAASAWLLDAQPRRPPGLGAVVNSATPAAGLAIGAIGAGALVQYGPYPLRLVYVVLLAGFVLSVVAVAVLADPVDGRRRIRPGDLRPRLALARPLRPVFLAVLPCLVATWALGGLYLSLGPTVVLSLEHSQNRLVGAVAVFLLTGAGAVSSVLLRHLSPRSGVLGGSTLLAAGVVVSLAGVAVDSAALYLAGSAVAGAGFGWAFLGAYRTLTAVAAPADRGGLVSSIYVASYLAFSVPAVLAGVMATAVGLRPTTVAYGLLVVGLAVLSIVLTARQRHPGAVAGRPVLENAAG
jgi:hypothetical protein